MLQETRSKTSYEKWLSDVIQQIKKQGYDNIRADLNEYEPPNQLIGKTKKLNFTPDATATKNEGKAYFEISTKMDNPSDLINKWKLLETLAHMKNGKFEIYVPHGHMKFTEEIVRVNNINAILKKL